MLDCGIKRSKTGSHVAKVERVWVVICYLQISVAEPCYSSIQRRPALLEGSVLLQRHSVLKG